MSATDFHRVLVVGGGITGLTVAEQLADVDGIDVTLLESENHLGGKIRSGAFAGIDGVDEGADAFLRRVPAGMALVGRVGLDSELTSPTSARAAVWHHGLHQIPRGVVLGVPASIRPFATTGLLSWRGKARAALEPFLPRTPVEPDSIGEFVRARFGDEVHERLVDALVGSIYAADTDRFSLAAVPQLADLAARRRSLLIGARSAKAANAPRAEIDPIFAAPRGGMQALTDATAAAARGSGAHIRTGHTIESLESSADGWIVDDEYFDIVVLATPARASASLLRQAAPEVAGALASIEFADVALVTLQVDGSSWPERLHDRSGYLVPKPVQERVTAVSFGSQKWAHWRPDDGSQILRVSLGRDGAPILDLTDDAIVDHAVRELNAHLETAIEPQSVRVSHWPDAFPQYRPHHLGRVAHIDSLLPRSLLLAGASYRGIGIPACIADGCRAAAAIKARLFDPDE